MNPSLSTIFDYDNDDDNGQNDLHFHQHNHHHHHQKSFQNRRQNSHRHIRRTSTISTSKSHHNLLPIDNDTILPPEQEQGNVEYKLKLINPSPNRLEHLITQMKWRLEEGDGEAIYEIGVEDNGGLKGLTDDEISSSLQTLNLMANKINASVSITQEKLIESTRNDNNPRKALEVLVKKIPNDRQAAEIRISVLGNVETGKSSLLGVLTQGELDNGKGRARLNLFRHRHEIRSGRTSSINKEILGFDNRGRPIKYCDYQTSEEICQLSSKIIVFIDSGGHRKYLKTTVFSLTATHADYAILVIDALSPLDCGTNLLHLSLAIALEVPIMVVINKIDLCDQKMIDQIVNNVQQLIESSFCKNKKSITIKNNNDIIDYCNNNNNKLKNLVPIFLISCVNGNGLELLYKFLHLLEPSLDSIDRDKLIKQNCTFQIDQTFNIPNLGVVASGFLRSGLIEEGSVLKVGPLDDGHFVDVFVTSVQRHKVNRRIVRPGESSTLALNLFKNSTITMNDDNVTDSTATKNTNNSTIILSKIIRKGMVLLSNVDPNSICQYFQAQIYSLSYSSAVITLGSSAIVYIENVRQSGIILAIKHKEQIYADESATVIIRFIRRPEYIRNGYRLLLQFERAKAIGHVTKVFF
ncbi:GTP binding protein [Dermatophagoides pteronyssinus]|uniref:GTP binding protein n=1 Tax=Dermatophagoides pteronyssinus TaxID=6956 RepID=A0ABQ8JWD9_DERPT|nr:GTP binding protein [Dermatophagoides pteronyssinus]